MSTVRSNAAASLSSIFGAISETAATVTTSVSSVNKLASSAHVKAHFYAERVATNAKRDHKRYLREDETRSAIGMAEFQRTVAEKLEKDATLAALYEESLAYLRSE